MASKRLKAAMSKNLAALQDNATDGTLGVHELFELASPSGSLVGFSIKGQLSSGGQKSCRKIYAEVFFLFFRINER